MFFFLHFTGLSDLLSYKSEEDRMKMESVSLLGLKTVLGWVGMGGGEVGMGIDGIEGGLVGGVGNGWIMRCVFLCFCLCSGFLFSFLFSFLPSPLPFAQESHQVWQSYFSSL